MVGREYGQWDIIERIPPDESVSFTEAERALVKILKTWSDISEIIPLGDKWTDGVMILKPNDVSLKPKEIPIDTFFHKIVMVRDR